MTKKPSILPCYTIHAVPFMGIIENDERGDMRVLSFAMSLTGKRIRPIDLGWELFMTPRENLALIKESMKP